MYTARPIYLDHNATTPILPEVIDAMLPYLREHFGNASSNHSYDRRAHAAIERAREQVATLIDCHADEIVFTSGGTEASRMVPVRGLGGFSSRRDRSKIHSEILETENALIECGSCIDPNPPAPFIAS